MRLFGAVEITPALAGRIAAAGDELKRRALACAPQARITWIPADRLHLTMRFIGEIEPDRLAEVSAALAPALVTSVFELTVSGVDVFPGSGAPRVLWAGLAGGADRLVVLETDVSNRLAGCGVPRKDRRYRPHLTLARVRDTACLRAGMLLDGLIDRAFGRTLDAITLFGSRLSPRGPTYVPRQRTPLRGWV